MFRTAGCLGPWNRWRWIRLQHIAFLTLLLLAPTCGRTNMRQYSKEDLNNLRNSVSDMFHHAYDSYLKHAYPYDELRPLSCSGVDTWGSYSLTLIDALDTLAILGNHTEFRRVYHLLSQKIDFNKDINVSVFETNIRIVGGLLSAHLMAHRTGAPLEKGWPCTGPLLRLAEDVTKRLLPAFDTPTGMPYGTVNLRHGVPVGETPVTCTASIGTMIIEFGTLSRLTGNPLYEETAMRALRALWYHRSKIGLVGNHIDVVTGKWTATDAGIGAGVDSYYEYLAKGSILLQRPELMEMFKQSQEGIEQYMKHDDWHFWVSMNQGSVSMPVFQSLEAFWPGVLSLIGENIKGLKSIHNYHQIWKQYGFLPEFYNVPQSEVSSKREGYPLRPELIESAMYLYRATKDPFLLSLGEDMLNSIEFSARTDCGYATVKDVRTHKLEDRMESFFLAETTKYLYLLFDTENFIHNPGTSAKLLKTAHGQCVIDAGGFIFNSEAHPVDPAALNCCYAHTEEEVQRHISDHMLDILDPKKFNEFQGDLIPQRINQIRAAQAEEAEKRKKRKEEFEKRMEEQREKEREAIKRKKELEALRKKMKQEEDEQKKMAESREFVDEDGTVVVEGKVEEHEDDDDDPQSVFEKEVIEGGGDGAGNMSKNPRLSDLDFDFKVSEEDMEVGEDDAESDMDETANGEDARLIPSGQGEAAAVGKLEESPNFSGDVISVPVTEDHQPDQVLIKRQSKDETTEALPAASPKVVASNNVIETLTVMINKLLPAARKEFDYDDFNERVMKGGQYVLNERWYRDHFVMSCPAQSFLERFSLQGEFFDKY